MGAPNDADKAKETAKASLPSLVDSLAHAAVRSSADSAVDLYPLPYTGDTKRFDTLESGAHCTCTPARICDASGQRLSQRNMRLGREESDNRSGDVAESDEGTRGTIDEVPGPSAECRSWYGRGDDDCVAEVDCVLLGDCVTDDDWDCEGVSVRLGDCVCD